MTPQGVCFAPCGSKSVVQVGAVVMHKLLALICAPTAAEHPVQGSQQAINYTHPLL